MKTSETKDQENSCGGGCREDDASAEIVDIDQQESKSTAKKEEIDYKSKFFYLAAEVENMRKRFEREKEGIVKFGTEKVLSSLVPIIDNLDRTIEATQKEQDEKIKNLRTGVEMIRHQFLHVLEGAGLKQMSDKGKAFDPNFHEALMQEESADQPEGTILKEFEKGYLLNGRLLRAAKVVVANKKHN